MRIVVCGSRKWTDRDLLFQKLDEVTNTVTDSPHFTIVHGGAIGADRMADEWARSRQMPTEEYLPEWTIYGRSAAFVRNIAMLDSKPDVVVAFHRNNSPGTKHMINNAIKRKLNLVVVNG